MSVPVQPQKVKEHSRLVVVLGSKPENSMRETVTGPSNQQCLVKEHLKPMVGSMLENSTRETVLGRIPVQQPEIMMDLDVRGGGVDRKRQP